MVIFHCYVSSPEGIQHNSQRWVFVDEFLNLFKKSLGFGDSKPACQVEVKDWRFQGVSHFTKPHPFTSSQPVATMVMCLCRVIACNVPALGIARSKLLKTTVLPCPATDILRSNSYIQDWSLCEGLPRGPWVHGATSSWTTGRICQIQKGQAEHNLRLEYVAPWGPNRHPVHPLSQ